MAFVGVIMAVIQHCHGRHYTTNTHCLLYYIIIHYFCLYGYLALPVILFIVNFRPSDFCIPTIISPIVGRSSRFHCRSSAIANYCGSGLGIGLLGAYVTR